MLYVNGKFVGLKEFSEPVATKAECLAEAQREVLKILEGAPEGASVLGACIPIPPAPPSQVTKDDSSPSAPLGNGPNPKNLTAPDGRQTI